jgi:hypothetical protein
LRLGIAASQFGRRTRRRFGSGRGRRGMELRRRGMELRRRGIELGRRINGLFGSTLLFILLLDVADHDVVSHPVAVFAGFLVVAVLGNMGLAEANEASLLFDETAFTVIGSWVRRAAEWAMAMLFTQ